ncbi:polymer-forming cytoskeletal protein [Flexibacterium corallicola]|uniref:polymer-forming cytoskeletal protein n=1 Tax=Flexibacterium corallicola TaxID=3037259 RepID=UPI00286F1B27|nr:polymer-forming cytoskeletal protein [Pseudovibrio sp. M1P-2-3]
MILSAAYNKAQDAFSPETTVQGNAKKDIIAKKVTICENAVLVGSIKADTVIIHGSVQGDIKSKICKISNTASVKGNIQSEKLTNLNSFEGYAFVDLYEAGKNAVTKGSLYASRIHLLQSCNVTACFEQRGAVEAKKLEASIFDNFLEDTQENETLKPFPVQKSLSRQLSDIKRNNMNESIPLPTPIGNTDEIPEFLRIV